MEILGVIVAAAVGFGYGALHYMTLAKPWIRASGVKLGPDGRPAGGGSALPFVLSGIAMLLVAGFMRHVFASAGIESAGAGLVAGFGVGAFFIAPWIMINNAYPGRPFVLTLIDGGYAVIGCALMGLVLGLF
ncbi:MAG: DUF1761 domain-containing protein [Paracoccaceae bacterium]